MHTAVHEIPIEVHKRPLLTREIHREKICIKKIPR